MQRWIILTHRYLGIPMSCIFVLWFVSGVVLMYTGDMPSLSQTQRLLGNGLIEPDTVALLPSEAAAAAGVDEPVGVAALEVLLGRPAWRFEPRAGGLVRVFADNGEVFAGAAIEAGRAEVARFTSAPLSAVSFDTVVQQADQWTIALSRSLPLDRYVVDDGRGTRAWFSRATGRVELVTTRSDRLLAWAGAIPHWFYFTPLRLNQPLWYWTVVWVAAAGCLLAALGLILAFTRFRRSRPFSLSASVRYRGWMRWHYYGGALFGVFGLTWVFSGLLSMEPFAWTNANGMSLPANRLQGDGIDAGQYDDAVAQLLRRRDADIAGIELVAVLDKPWLLVTAATAEGASEERLYDAQTLALREDPLPAEPLLAELERTVTAARILDFTTLNEYDGYYYARGAPLPVLRVRFDDPAASWYYFDLTTYATVGQSHRLGRIERWLFNGLHSLDFSFWYYRRPLWDIGMILLCAGALATSGIGMYLGIRRLFGRAARSPRERAPT